MIEEDDPSSHRPYGNYFVGAVPAGIYATNDGKIQINEMYLPDTSALADDLAVGEQEGNPLEGILEGVSDLDAQKKLFKDMRKDETQLFDEGDDMFSTVWDDVETFANKWNLELLRKQTIKRALKRVN